MKRDKKILKGQGGAVLVSYVVGLGAILTALLAPIPVFNNKTAVELLVAAIKTEYAGYEYAIGGESDVQTWSDFIENN